jgi:hypothetical protein
MVGGLGNPWHCNHLPKTLEEEQQAKAKKNKRVPLVNPQDELSPVFEELTGLLKDMKSNAEVFAVKQWMEEKVTALKAHQIEQQTLGDAVKIRAEGSS